MSYLVIRTIKGKQYRYRQTSYRVGKKVKTKGIYLGAVDAGSSGLRPVRQWINTEKFEEQALQQRTRDIEAHKALVEGFEKQSGLKIGKSNPEPIDKPAPAIDLTAPAATPAPETGGEDSST